MSVSMSLMVLLGEGDAPASMLWAKFIHRTQGTRPVRVAQVYELLDRLERTGMVETNGTDANTGRPAYSLTALGRDHVESLLVRPTMTVVEEPELVDA